MHPTTRCWNRFFFFFLWQFFGRPPDIYTPPRLRPTRNIILKLNSERCPCYRTWGQINMCRNRMDKTAVQTRLGGSGEGDGHGNGTE